MNDFVISAALALEFPVGEYMKVLLNKREVILNKKQTLVWRKLRRHESVSSEELYGELNADSISKKEFDDCIDIFMLNKMVTVVTDSW